MGKVSLGRRLAGAIVIQIVVAAAYVALAAGGIAPVLSSVTDISASGSARKGPKIVAGYYISQPFTSLGTGLPPYVFAQDTTKGSPAVHVSPALSDIRPGRLAAVIDTSTGDGSRWSPDDAHTIASWQTFQIGLGIAAVLLVIVEVWLGGYLAAAFSRRRSGATRGALQKQA